MTRGQKWFALLASTIAIAVGLIAQSQSPVAQPQKVAVSNFPATQNVSVTNTPTVNQGGAPWSVAQSGTWTDRIVGNGGAALDSTVAPGAAPTNGVAVLHQYNTSAPALTNGQTVAMQSDALGNQRVNPYGNVGSFTSQHVSATGSQASLTVPAGEKWIVFAVNAQLACSATAATRTFLLQALDGSSNQLTQIVPLASSTTAFTQAASNTTIYNFLPSFNYFQTGASSLFNNFSMPFAPLYLGPGMILRSNVQALQAGDSVGITAMVFELPD